ncbi:MAG: acyl-CoA synthetase [Elusimicrobia bacterium CG1_02_37_114]|nr:MAG: acyl-CoA synthetase [Elusimicrobia bacterium CG1_02_37_114]PIZ13995.1 MAG: acyl-CoA synthetase [Elusimicrobia bacterium CG_4_10_14_0_8_um_filter_37_32]
MKSKNFQQIFYPASIAVVGATNTPGTVPNDIFTNIMRSGFPGPIYPVSPGNETISGAKAYKYVLDVPHPVDLAVIVFPSSVCSMALEQCGQKGIKAVIIISAGFKETGQKGKEQELKLKTIADKYNMSVIGPNCLGVINADRTIQLNASFARKMPDEGSIGFLSQSGALCTAVLDYALNKLIGFSKFVSFGNKMDINEVDLLQYLFDDEKTKTILLYLEEVSLGKELFELMRKNKNKKPVLALKSGRTSAGMAAAQSHTGSLAGSDEVCDAAFRQMGIIRAKNIEEMFNYAIALTYQPLPKSNRVAIVTNAGGPGVMAADSAIENGLELAKFSPETTEILKNALPRMANIKNPVDVIGDARADRYDAALTSISKDNNVDGIVCILTPQSMTDIESIAQLVCRVEKEMDKPLLCSFMGGTDVASGIRILEERQIPHYTLPESACQSLKTAVRYTNWLLRPESKVKKFEINYSKAKEIIEKSVNDKKSYLTEPSALELMSCYGFPILKHGLAKNPEDAVKIAGDIGFPVVMKIVSSDVLHKSDVGGVLVDLQNSEQVQEGFKKISDAVRAKKQDADILGILVEKMANSGQEVIMGIKRDPSFGAVIMFGSGGIFVELMKDITLRTVPITELDAEEMIKETKSYILLSGFRGAKPSDIQSVKECLERLSQMAMDFPQITELDINPLVVYEKGCHIIDARIMLNVQ